MKEKSLYGHKIYSILFALVVCLFWGSLYPCISMGDDMFGYDAKHIPSVMLFAGLRFLVCGIVMTAGVSVRDKKIKLPDKVSILPILAVAFTTIVIHYSFQYMGVSLIEVNASSKSAILKQIGYLFISCFAFLFVKEDKFSVRKVIGGTLGFCGIIVVNLDGLKFSVGIGEVCIICASVLSVAGTVISKHVYKKLDTSYVVAYSQLIGGIVLTLAGLALGGKLTTITLRSVLLLCYMCFASITAYLLWGKLIKYNDVSKMSILKYFEPVFGVFISGVVLKTDSVYKLEYFFALLIILVAILVANLDVKKKKAE